MFAIIATLAATGAILVFGKTNKGYKLIEPFLDKVIKYFISICQ